MELREIYHNQNYGSKISPKISFEVFPPKDGNISKLFEELRILKKYNPVLVSLTYGANGGARVFSLEILRMILDLELNVMPHFTCVGATKELIEHYITQIENMGIENILALRGDGVGVGVNDVATNSLNSSQFADNNGVNVATNHLKTSRGSDNSVINICGGDFSYANELVEFIQQKSTLSIGVAGYPECHIEVDNLQADIQNLKRKVDAGASAIFTQLFFDNEKFYKYLEMVQKAGVDLPVIPGIMPVRSLKQMDKMVNMTRVKVPVKFRHQLEKFPKDTLKIGAEFAISQCQDLMDNGINAFHFFTLNHSNQVSEILDELL